MLFLYRKSPMPALKELEIVTFILLSWRLATLRAAVLLINGIATFAAVGFLADGVPSLAHELRSERDARAQVEIEAFLASLTPDEKAILYRTLSSTNAASASVQANDARDDAVLEKFRQFWDPFQSYRKQAQLWGNALRSVSSGTKAPEVWVALILLAVVAMTTLALRAHLRET